MAVTKKPERIGSFSRMDSILLTVSKVSAQGQLRPVLSGLYGGGPGGRKTLNFMAARKWRCVK